MANLAAHAVASHAVAKQGAGGPSTPAGAGGLEAIFAALLAQASGTAGDATAPEVADPATPAAAASAAKHMAELLNSSAKIPAAGTQGPTHRNPAKQDAANSNATLAVMAAQLVAPPAKPGIADGVTQKSPQPGKREAQGATAAPAPDGNKDKDEHATDATAPAVIVAAPVQPVTAQATAPASRSADDDAAKTADPAVQRATVQQALLEAGATVQDAQPNSHHPAAEPQATGANPAAPSQAPSQAATGAAQSQSLETALAALQAAAQKPVTANAHADTAQPATRAVTALEKAAFAAAADKATHQDMPAQRTASALPPSAESVAAQPQSGATGSGNHGSDTQSRNGSAHTSSDTPSASPAASQATQAPGQFAQAVQNAAPFADPSAGAQSTAANMQAQAPVTASLHVAPQSAAQAAPGQQGIALSDFGAIAVNIAAQSKDGAKEFNIALHPQDLGSIHVRLSVDHVGAAQAHLSAENPQTLTLLQRDSHLLERALKDAGLNLAGGSLNFSLKGQDRQTGNGAQSNGRSRSLSVTAVANTNAPVAGPASTYNLAPDDVRLDIRV